MTKEARTYNGVTKVSSIVLGKLDRYMQKNGTALLSRVYTRINSKWIKHLNVRLKTIKILEENMGSKISDISCSSIFSDISLRQEKHKKKKWDYIQLKSFHTVKETITKMKRQPTEWDNMFTAKSDKGLISKI